MKNLISALLIAFTASFMLFSCNTKKDFKAESTGKPYEVYVICSKEVWNSKAGDTLRAAMLEPVKMINQREPSLNVVHILPGGVNRIIENHRNLLFLSIADSIAEPGITAKYDIKSQPQIVVNVFGPNDSTVTDYIWQHRQDLIQVFEMAERDRFLTNLKRINNKPIQEEIKKKFGFEMEIPDGYKIANNTRPDFLWLRNEMPLTSQGILIYSYPYTGKEDFSVDSLVSKRNQFAKLIPGPSDGSHMITTTGDMAPEVTLIRLNNRLWAEMQGFWDVKGDFMGGPFRSYSTLDQLNNRVICLDMYIFAPTSSKRNLVRQVENLMYTVRLQGDKSPETTAAADSLQK